MWNWFPTASAPTSRLIGFSCQRGLFPAFLLLLHLAKEFLNFWDRLAGFGPLPKLEHSDLSCFQTNVASCGKIGGRVKLLPPQELLRHKEAGGEVISLPL